MLWKVENALRRALQNPSIASLIQRLATKEFWGLRLQYRIVKQDFFEYLMKGIYMAPSDFIICNNIQFFNKGNEKVVQYDPN